MGAPVVLPADLPNPLNPGRTMYVYPTGKYYVDDQGNYTDAAGNPVSPQNRVEVLAVDTTNLSTGHYLNTLSMDKIYDLLVHMLTVLQDVAVAQAGQLKFLTTWQKAYTDRMSHVHTFVALNGDAIEISGTGTNQGTQRQDLNASATTLTEKDRSAGSIVGDTAKALQANVSQTQDAINQQSNMATSIIQQFNTILASIYK